MIARQTAMLGFLRGFRRKARRREFLEAMDSSVPREAWPALIRPFFCADCEAKAGGSRFRWS